MTNLILRRTLQSKESLEAQYIMRSTIKKKLKILQILKKNVRLLVIFKSTLNKRNLEFFIQEKI
ncbi:hypothetical protein BpHYR1_045645 [Brachionus plicatilis]|uniref:Uncharacterized protein n=1 Tax=Brachionus plicatilis TaxID=10195 RepID=A0A3M7TC19_BRAPC|nr:hypothetical protein BpHYR1_045645 [Brachionus plicatilis]